MTWEFPSELWDHRFVLLGAYFCLIGGELAWRALQGRALTSPGLLITNVGMWLVELGLRAGTFGVRLAVFSAVATLVPVRWQPSIWYLVPVYVLVDFV